MMEVFYKKNETFNFEFYKDKACTDKITDFSGYSNIYIQLKDGDCTPLFLLPEGLSYYVPYIPNDIINWNFGYRNIFTLNDTIRGNLEKTLDLSKYIKGNTFLFFENDCCKSIVDGLQDMQDNIPRMIIGCEGYKILQIGKTFELQNSKHITIFLESGTEDEIKKANEVAKELKEKYNVERVELFVLYCFIAEHRINYDTLLHVDKTITTNSTNMLEVQKYPRLEVIDCKELFESVI